MKIDNLIPFPLHHTRPSDDDEGLRLRAIKISQQMELDRTLAEIARAQIWEMARDIFGDKK